MATNVNISDKEYKNIKISGSINVAPVETEVMKNQDMRVFLLMGPTGSGKSAFIESLSSDRSLSISKDSLESVTQEVTCYRVLGMIPTPDDIVKETILIDTPGFLDIKLSETRITNMIIHKLDGLRTTLHDIYVYLCYFQPITDVRMGGSKRGAIKLLRAFAQSFGAQHIHVVTSMWNHVSTQRQMIEAAHRYDSLGADIYQTGEMEIHISKFALTQVSALDFIDLAIGTASNYRTQKRGAEYESMHRDNLLDRISNSCQQLQFLAEDRQNAMIPGHKNYPLLEIIHRNEKVAFATLQSFLDDLYQLDPASHASLIASIPLPEKPSPPRLSLGLMQYRVGHFVSSVGQGLHRK